jgi:hypothetical protein
MTGIGRNLFCSDYQDGVQSVFLAFGFHGQDTVLKLDPVTQVYALLSHG